MSKQPKKLKPFYTDDRKSLSDINKKYIRAPQFQDRVRVSADNVVSNASIGFLRGRQSGVYDAYRTLKRKYPEIAKELIDAYGMNRDGSITL